MYKLIYTDFSWDFKTYSELGAGRSPKYRTLDVQAGMDLPVGDLADRDAILLSWATSPFLADAIRMGEAWGAAANGKKYGPYLYMRWWEGKTHKSKYIGQIGGDE